MAFVPLPAGPVAQALGKLGILLRPGTNKVAVGSGGRNAAIKLFNELRGTNPVTRRAPGLYTAASINGQGTITFRFPNASSSNMWSVDFHMSAGALKKIHF